MDSDDRRIDLDSIEIEMLLAALNNYEVKVLKKRSDTIRHVILAVRHKLTIASQNADPGISVSSAP